MPAKAQSRPKKEEASSAVVKEPVDKVMISPEGRRAYAQETGPFSEMKTLVLNEEEREKLLEEARALNGSLVTNDDLFMRQLVDPKGEIYSKTYMESLAGQIARVTSAVEEYYAPANEENLTFSDPFMHIREKYQISSSPYFRKDMSEAERAMAFKQEVSFLQRGRFYALNDPYALASLGGPLNMNDADQAARQAAKDKIDESVRKMQEAQGINSSI